MKYVSLDLETTSLQPKPDHILMVSMVVEDTSSPIVPVEELPHFTCFVNPGRIQGEAYALGMNGWILDYISGRKKDAPYPVLLADYYTAREEGKANWEEAASEFLDLHFGKEKITVAGKNVASFDLKFL